MKAKSRIRARFLYLKTSTGEPMASPWDEYARSPSTNDEAEAKQDPPMSGDYYNQLLRGAGFWRDFSDDAVGGAPPPTFPAYNPAIHLDPKTDASRTVTIGGRTYLGVDNGHADVLVPYTTFTAPSGPDPGDATRDANRTNFMADHPLGAAAYGVASIFGAPEWVRDTGLAAGGAADTLLFGAAPYAAETPTVASEPPRAYAPPVRQTGLSYGEPDAYGRPTGARGWVTQDTLGAGTKADRSITPPGWGGNGTRDNQARAHLGGALLGGLGVAPNLVTMTQNPTNAPVMSGVERRAARAAANGEVINYSAVPLYSPGGTAPSHVLITAHGSRGYREGVVIPNPAGLAIK